MLATKFSQWIDVSATNGNHLYTFYEKASDFVSRFFTAQVPMRFEILSRERRKRRSRQLPMWNKNVQKMQNI